jgi:lipopolysaccharide export LptBFGC system permease protein LptF
VDIKSKKEFTDIVVDALNDVMIPAMEDMERRLKNELVSKDDLHKTKAKLESRLDKIESDVYFIKQDVRDIKTDLSDTPSRAEFNKLKAEVNPLAS